MLSLKLLDLALPQKNQQMSFTGHVVRIVKYLLGGTVLGRYFSSLASPMTWVISNLKVLPNFCKNCKDAEAYALVVGDLDAEGSCFAVIGYLLVGNFYVVDVL